jgi:uncharacterized protein (DUF2252 family)
LKCWALILHIYKISSCGSLGFERAVLLMHSRGGDKTSRLPLTMA